MFKLAFFICALVLFLLTSASSFASTLSWPSDKTINSTKSATLVELFTSQGCSSCPPAERYLNKFEQHTGLWTDIVPVAFHVDYWNHLGWKDPYASSAFSHRQRQYRKNNNIKSVYTPGFVVNGREWRGYYYKKTLPTQKSNTQLHLTFKDNNLEAVFKAVSSSKNSENSNSFENSKNSKNSKNFENHDLILNMAIVGIGINTHIKRGENENRKLEQDFTVLQHNQYKSKNGQWAFSPTFKNIADSPKYGVAFWVQDAVTLDVLHATGTAL